MKLFKHHNILPYDYPFIKNIQVNQDSNISSERKHQHNNRISCGNILNTNALYWAIATASGYKHNWWVFPLLRGINYFHFSVLVIQCMVLSSITDAR